MHKVLSTVQMMQCLLNVHECSRVTLGVKLEDRVQAVVGQGARLQDPCICNTHAPSGHQAVSHRSAQQFRAVKADTAQDLHHICNKANMKHGFGQLNVAKIARTVLHSCPICLTFEVAV